MGKKKKLGARGKYREWLTEDGLTLLRGWARDGLTDEQIAKNIGIARGTLYSWKNKHGDIDDALKKGKAVINREVEEALIKSALGYEFEEVETFITINPDGSKSQRVKKVQRYSRPDTTALIFFLKNRMPNEWRNNPVPDTGIERALVQARTIADMINKPAKDRDLAEFMTEGLEEDDDEGLDQ